MVLIGGYDFRLATPDCHPDAGYFRAHVEIVEDLTEVLPYLNAELEGANYNHGAKALIWPGKGRKFAFRPHEIVVSPVKDREEAERFVQEVVSLVNKIWERRTEIEPSFEGRKPLPNVLDIYKRLPKSNCRECGSPSCMAFAAVIREDPEKLCLCPHVSEEIFT